MAEEGTNESRVDRAIELVASRGFAPGISPKPDDVLKMSQTLKNLAETKAILQALNGKK